MAKFTISIHAPAKGATFFTHPYKACPTISIHAPAKGATSVGSVMDMFTGISIHAPAKGATDTSLKIYPKITISIHAPAKGATINCPFGFLIVEFQSTLPRRERPVSDGLSGFAGYFNPRSREGSDTPVTAN